jgi:glycosyltransferase involved in cell wall biosynthesis
MRVAIVSHPWSAFPQEAQLGGEPTWTYEVARRLARDCEVIVFARRHRVPNGGAPAAAYEQGVLYRQVMARSFMRILNRLSRFRTARRPLFGSGLYELPFALAVAAEVRRRRCDVVHIQGMSQFVPIVRALNPAAAIVLHAHMEWLTQLDRDMIARRLRHANLILGCSEFIAGRIRAAFPQFASRCRAVYNGVDLDLFAPGPEPGSNHRAGTQRVMYAGRLSPEKGLHVLLDAFQLVAKRWPQATLEIIGPEGAAGQEFVVALSDEARVRALAAFYEGPYLAALQARLSPDVAERVFLCHRMPHPQLAARLRAATVFVHPAVWNEPFGMNVVEAMASGVPVIASRAGGPAETIVDSRTGVLVPPADVPALAEAILRLLPDEQLRRALGRAARRRAVELFSWDGIATKMLNLYQELRLEPAAGTPDQQPAYQGLGA